VSDKEAIERFQREAETVATLHHTNIVPIYFVGSEKGVNYYAMQFIEGRNLAELMADSWRGHHSRASRGLGIAGCGSIVSCSSSGCDPS
jgi:eukaryotic-like serine/threonine-protein kinase